MAPTTHSAFSASASSRLLACPGSYQRGIDAATGERKSSIYAAEGTLAHAISEACVFSGRDPVDFLGQTRTVDGFAITINQEFVEGVEVYVNFLRGLRAMGYIIMLETRVSPTWAWDDKEPLPVDLFGTSDCIAYHPASKTLIIADLKFGRGIAVEVLDNSQLLYYATGSLNPAVLRTLMASHDLPEDVDPAQVELVVVQPRAPHPAGPIRRATYATQFVRDWARNVLYPGVATALSDNGKTLNAGKHCRFCPAPVGCAAQETLLVETARAAFAGAPLENLPDPNDPLVHVPAVHLPDAELGALLDKIAVCKPWMNLIEAIAADRMEAGNDVTGWKLVPKQARRKWADDDSEVLALLDRTPLDPDDFSTRALLTPAQVERKVGKQAYKEIVAPHVVKQSSGYNIAPEGDPRARVHSRTAQEAFAEQPPEAHKIF